MRFSRFSLRLFSAPVCVLSIAELVRFTRVSHRHVYQGVMYSCTLRLASPKENEVDWAYPTSRFAAVLLCANRRMSIQRKTCSEHRFTWLVSAQRRLHCMSRSWEQLQTTWIAGCQTEMKGRVLAENNMAVRWTRCRQASRPHFEPPILGCTGAK